jgi:hypothetical protein
MSLASASPGVRAFRVEAGFAATPSGITAQSARQFFASVAYTPGSQFRLFQGGAQLTFQSVQLNGQPARNALWLSLNAGRLIDWGLTPRPAAPYETRALQLGQPSQLPPPARVEIFAYEDTNQNDSRDPGESAVAGITLHIGPRQLSTDSSGIAAVALPPGRFELLLDSALVARSFVIAHPLAPFDVQPGRRKTVTIALVPAGRLTGRLTFSGESPDPELLAGIRIVARSSSMTRELITTASGDLQFGLLPVGDYVVEVDIGTLATETRLVGPARASVRITRGERTAVTFTLRKATLRERFSPGV